MRAMNMRKNGLRIDIVLRDPVSGRVYKKKDTMVNDGIKDMYTFIAMKYQSEKKRQATAIKKEMQSGH